MSSVVRTSDEEAATKNLKTNKAMENGSSNPFDGLEDDEEDSYTRPDLPLHERLPSEQVEYHWNTLEEIIKSKVTDPFSLEDFRKHLTAIQSLIIHEKPASTGRTGDCLEFLLSENIMENVYLFSTRQRVYGKEVRIILLKFFTEVFTYSFQPILIHQQILRPLSRLLRASEGTKDRELSSALVPLLHRLCILMQENQSLLDLFFIDAKVHHQSKFLIFTQLVPHMHEVNETGNRARDALLLCLSLAAQLPGSNLSRFIAVDCNFCQVLATGLSGLYSDLPTSQEISVDDWLSPLPVIETEVTELEGFIQALKFCNSVLQMAPKVVCDTVLSLVREGFLQQVLGSALLQASQEAVTFATAYLIIFLTHITNIPLMREFLRYVILGQIDGRSVLNALIQNISSTNVKLCSVTLELFHVLFDLNCEDVMLELILKHLICGNHVMPNQLAIVGSPDIYCQASRRFLQLLPTICINAEKRFLESIKSSPQPSPGASRTSSPPPPPPLTSSPAPSHSQLERPTPLRLVIATKPNSMISATTASSSATNPFDAPSSRSRSGSNASSCSSISLSSSSSVPHSTGGAAGTTTSTTTGTGGTIGSFRFEQIPPEMAFLYNLEAARQAIHTCATKCQCWANLYDKCEVSKETLKENLKEPVKAMEMEDVHVRVQVTSAEDDFPNLKSNAGGFRSRSATISHARISRTTSLRVRGRLSPGRTTGEHTREETSGDQRCTSESPQASPKLPRRRSEDKSRFEDVAGLLLKVLFEKLSDMLQQPPTVNVLLTRILSRLAHYPQPLLRSLLLNHHLVLRPGVPNLLAVLQSIKVTIDGYVRTQEGFEVRLARARKTMIYRAHMRNSQHEDSVATQVVAAEMRRLIRQTSKVLELSDTPELKLLTKQDSVASEIGDIVPSSLKKRGSKLSIEVTEDPIPRHRAQTEGTRGLANKRRKKKKVPTNTLFAVVIFDEFLRELAALSQAHSVLDPLLYMPKSVT